MESNQSSSLFQLSLDGANSYTLRSAASWARILGIGSLIIGALCIILGIVVQQAMSKAGGYGGIDYRDSGFSASSLGNMGMAVYVIMGIVYILSGVFALNAGNKINAGLKTNSIDLLIAGFAGARNFFALWAVLIILFLILILISLLGALSNL